MLNISDIISNSKRTDNKLITLFSKQFIAACPNNREENNTKVELLINLVPADHLIDIKSVVTNPKGEYKGDFLKYFEDVAIYFETFTNVDLEFTKGDDLLAEKDFYVDLYREKGNDTAVKRYLKRIRKQKLFHSAALLKLVGKGANFYCPKTLFDQYKYTKEAEQEFINSRVVVGTNGKAIPLADCVKNAEQQTAEKLNIINTIERIALDKGWTWAFITLTLGKDEEGKSYHANPMSPGENFEYNGVSPRDSSKLLKKKIVEVKKMLAKRGLNPSTHYIGAVCSEAHKGGVVHLHMIIFFHADKTEIIKDCFFAKFTNLKMNESKSFQLEDTSKPIKKEGEEYVKGKFRSSATNYAFKYLMKSITAYDPDMNYQKIKHNSDKDDKGNKIELTFEQKQENLVYASMLNSAFRSFNGIRGFSFFGIENCLTKFRFLARNLKSANLPAIFEKLVKDNDLYNLIKGNYFENVENIYIETENGKKFVGCKVDSNQVLKNFFAMVKKAVADSSPKMCGEIALLNEMDCMFRLGLFSYLGVLKQKHTRKAKDNPELSKKEKEDWLKWVEDNPPIEEIEFFEIIDTSDCPF